MIKIMVRILVIILTLAYLWLLNTPLFLAGNPLPPLGSFLNPFQGFWQNAEAIDHFETLELVTPQLTEEVNLIFDERAVPHIFSSSKSDQAFAQGYMHAKDRLWQMDLTTRQAAGRLSEVFGKRVLALDRRNRNMGMPTSAQKYAEAWKSCEEIKVLESYVAGVNYYIEHLKPRDYPLEFKLFNYKPELWSVDKCALVMMSMNLALCARYEDISATNTLKKIGKEKFTDLFPLYNDKQSPIIPNSAVWTFTAERDTSWPRYLTQSGPMPSPTTEGVGSNNWAIGPAKAASGFPILCNDPHLQLTLPSIWYEMHMCLPDQNVYGVTFPGIPEIIIGFNEDIAWGQTNVGMDVLDLYDIKWADDTKTKYYLDDEVLQVEKRIETYQVRNDATVTDTVAYTFWGPVVNHPDKSLAMKWLPNHTFEGCALNTFSKLNAAQNYDDYYDALSHFSSPPQNFVFAAKDGDIAIKVQGKLPIKSVHQGRFIMDGSSSQNDWSGFIAHENSPQVKNPVRGFVSSANQHSTDPSYPYFYHGYFEDYRSRSLNDKLYKLENITTEDMQKLQNNNFSRFAADLCPLLVKHLENKSLSDLGYQVLEQLKKWDYNYDPKSPAPKYFQFWSSKFYQLVWDEFDHDEEDMLKPETWRTIQLLEEEPDSEYFDIAKTSRVESSGEIAQISFEKTLSYFDSLQISPDLAWQEYRNFQIPHLSRLPAFSELDVKTGGTSTALNAVSPRNAPSWRMIVELGEKVKAWGIYPGGASGNPGSPYYKTGIEPWSKGKYFTLRFVSSSTDFEQDAITSSIKMKP